MITDVVIVPGAPLLLPEYQGRVAAAPDLLESCVAVVREAVGSAHHVVVVHATDRARSSKPAIGLRVADHLLAATHEDFDVEHMAVSWDATVEDCVSLGHEVASRASSASDPESSGLRTTLLVVADGSARRTEKAPGHLDPRAEALDAMIVDAIRGSADGGLSRLLKLDPELCSELLVAGRAPLQVLAAAAGATTREGATKADGERAAYEVVSCEVSDPFGVLYVVAHLRDGT